MKITDVTLTLFTWDGLPKISYGPNIKLDGNSTLGLVSILTDQGVTGHSFLGGANRGADLEGKSLIDSLPFSSLPFPSLPFSSSSLSLPVHKT